MNKLLQLLVDDFQNQKPSAEYQLVLSKVCEVESAFMALLDKKQKAEYLKLDSVARELGVIELHEFAEFLYKHLKTN
jgi:hypothetical protein